MRSKEKPAKLICLYDPKSPIAEAYRTLRTNIQFASVNKEIKTLMVTSAGPGEGKTTTITNLAVAIAQAGKKVLLIDGDLRKPAVHKAFGLSNRTGLTNILSNQATVESAVQKLSEIELDIITAGPIPPNPAEFLGSRPMQQLLILVKDQYDMILIDTPPILPVTDGQVLSSYMDGVLLVLNAGKVARDHVIKAKALLDHVGANIIGTVLNNKKIDKDSYYNYYYYAESK